MADSDPSPAPTGRFVVTSYSIASVYSVVALWALFQCIRVAFRAAKVLRVWTHQVSVLAMLTLACVARATYFVILVKMRDGDEKSQQTITSNKVLSRVMYYSLNEIPGLLFLSSFSMLILHWSRLRGESSLLQPATRRSYRLAALLFNVAAYGTQLTLGILFWDMFDSKDEMDRYGIASEVAAAVFFSVLATVFGVYSRVLRTTLGHAPVDLAVRQAKTCELVGTSSLCAGCFAMRAATLLAVALSPPQTIEQLYWVLALYYPLLELVPSVIIIRTYRQTPDVLSPSPYVSRRGTPDFGDAPRVGQLGRDRIRQALLGDAASASSADMSHLRGAHTLASPRSHAPTHVPARAHTQVRAHLPAHAQTHSRAQRPTQARSVVSDGAMVAASVGALSAPLHATSPALGGVLCVGRDPLVVGVDTAASAISVGAGGGPGVGGGRRRPAPAAGWDTGAEAVLAGQREAAPMAHQGSTLEDVDLSEPADTTSLSTDFHGSM